MKYQISLWTVLLLTVLSACHETTVGFLITKNASYKPDSLFIRKTPDPKKDAVRIQYNAPWITLQMQGVEGTEPITYSVESVTSDLGKEAADVFKSELLIQGGGVLRYPLKNNALPGTYRVSVRLTNEGYSQVVTDAYTFIVEE